jgi:hypothetical protein
LDRPRGKLHIDGLIAIELQILRMRRRDPQGEQHGDRKQAAQRP